jgi:hypothetical protein
LLIPSAATVLFNVLGDMLKHGANSQAPPEAYDFSLGCAFAIVGAAVAQSNRDKAKTMFMAFLFLLLALILTDLIVRYKFRDWELTMIIVSDVIALGGTARAIWE